MQKLSIHIYLEIKTKKLKKMTRILIYTVIVLLTMMQSVFAQDTLELKTKEIARKIDSITTNERMLLKKEIRKLEKDYKNNRLTEEQVEKLKKEAVTKHARIIKQEIDKLEGELYSVIQNRIDDKLKGNKIKKNSDGTYTLQIKTRKKNSTESQRTFSNFVFAFGLNNVMLNADFNTIQDSPYKFGASSFMELGKNYKTRIFKENSVFYVDYGLSVRYNNLILKDNKYFVTNGNDTNLETFPHDLKKSKFKNVQLVVPLYLEMDFSKPKIKEDKKIFKRNKAFRLGFGGFGGINLKSKQILKYKLDGKKVRDKRKGDYNVTQFVYGLNAFIGYKDTSFYVKYDANDLFHNNFKNQHNISFGVRFDL